jgi:hypothetical protein
MGAYLYYKTDDDANEVQNYLLEENQLNMKLIDDLDEQGIFITCSKNDNFNKYSTGNIKTSIGTLSEKFEKAGYDNSDLLEMWTSIFEQLNEKFSMKYYANSCSFSLKEYYFSLEQMKRITNNGALLSGKTSKSERTQERYRELYEVLSDEPKKEIFDISVIRERDEVLINGEWRDVETFNDDLRLSFSYSSPDHLRKALINEKIASLIEDYKKYVPKIRYGGSVIDVEAYVLDANTLIYLETVGTENMVKSVTSVLMQGRVKMNDITIEASFGYFDINKAGNKRKIIPLDDGLAHSITYHSPTIADTKFSVLVGKDKDEIADRFSAWLENTNFLPFPKDLTNEIYDELRDREKITVLTSFGVEAIKIEPSLLEEEAIELQEIILRVCRTNGLIDENAKLMKQKAPLPQSQYLDKYQVEKIMYTLDGMPKTYELEDMDIKPIGLKLFSPNMTLYITDAHKGCEDDKFESEHTKCYGYIKNESDSAMSEWGYIDVPAYLEVLYPNSGGFEQDLYFEDMYIDSKGKITKNEIKKAS